MTDLTAEAVAALRALVADLERARESCRARHVVAVGGSAVHTITGHGAAADALDAILDGAAAITARRVLEAEPGKGYQADEHDQVFEEGDE